MRIWTYKNADEKAHTFSRRSENVKKRTKTYEKRLLCKFTFRSEVPFLSFYVVSIFGEIIGHFFKAPTHIELHLFINLFRKLLIVNLFERPMLVSRTCSFAFLLGYFETNECEISDFTYNSRTVRSSSMKF